MTTMTVAEARAGSHHTTIEEKPMNTITAIANAKTQTALSAVVESYLADLGQTEAARGETFEETAARLGDDIMDYAARRWWELAE